MRHSGRGDREDMNTRHEYQVEEVWRPGRKNSEIRKTTQGNKEKAIGKSARKGLGIRKRR